MFIIKSYLHYNYYYLCIFIRHSLQESDNCWWDAFATEFFEDDASLTLTFCLEDGPKRYSQFTFLTYIQYLYIFIQSFKHFIFLAIGRTLIPRYFRSIFDGGVSELYFHLKLAKESFHNPTITLDCDQCTMVTHHTVKPMFTKVSFSHILKMIKNLKLTNLVSTL